MAMPINLTLLFILSQHNRKPFKFFHFCLAWQAVDLCSMHPFVDLESAVDVDRKRGGRGACAAWDPDLGGGREEGVIPKSYSRHVLARLQGVIPKPSKPSLRHVRL